MALLQAVIVGLAALLITPGLLFYFDVTPKIAILLAGAAICLGFGGAGDSPALHSRTSRLLTGLLLFDLLSAILSAVLSSNSALSFFGTNWRRYGVVVHAAVLIVAWTVAAQTAGRRDRVRTILRAVSVAGAISALYGIAQYFGWDPILNAAGYHIGEGAWTIVRPPGTLGYVSYFATWLLAVGFLSLMLLELETSPAWRGIAIAAAALSVIAMSLTGTRAAMLGLVAGAAVWLFHRHFRVSRRIAAVAAVLALCAVAFYFSPAGWQLRSRARWFSEDRWGGARPALWRDSFRMAATHPAAGFGPEVFTARFPAYESRDLARAYPDFAHESPHNMFLDAFVAQGLPGLAAMLVLCAAALVAAWRASTPWLAAALVAQIVSQQFTVFTAATALVFYVTVALAMASPTEAPPLRWPWRLALTPVALALLYFAARYTLADRALARTQQAIARRDLVAAVVNYAAYDRARLPGATADLWYSRALLSLAQESSEHAVRLQALMQSGAAGLRATQTAEDPFDAWYSLAALYAAQNNAGGAEKSLREASAAHPNWFKPHWTLAQLLQLEGRLPEAETEAALAVDLDAGKHPEVAQALARIRTQRASVGTTPLQK